MSENRLLRPGQKLPLADSQGEVVVGDFIGAGGQGEVYRARVFGHDAALKWYFPSYLSQDPGLWNRLERIVFSARPSPSFVWPYARVREGRSRFGYLMPLRSANYLSFKELVFGEVDRSFELLTRVALNTCESLRKLHLKGLCYRDLNLGNFYFDPLSGAVEVLDNDNTDVEGQAFSIGVADFAAPELLLGTASASRYTDLWSLAVLLFQITMLQDPFVGERLLVEHRGVYDVQAARALHARPVFLFDPVDTSNAPLPEDVNAQTLWPCYTKSLRDLFVRAFTTGRVSPRARVTEAEWAQALVRANDAVFPCPSCGVHNIADLDPPRSSSPDCLSCGAPLTAPPILKIGAWRVVLRAGARLYPYHLERHGEYALADPIAEVLGSPLRLKNMSNKDWKAGRGVLRRQRVLLGDAVQLDDGVQLDFGTAMGRVEYQTSNWRSSDAAD